MPELAKRTRIAIIGAGPAGMFLGHLLHQAGIETLILERRDRAYVEGRVRAGVLERITVETLARLGLDGRLRRDGLVHSGTKFASDGEVFRIDLERLTGGSTITVYGQQEVMKDLFDAAAHDGPAIIFGAEDVALHDLAGHDLTGHDLTGHAAVTWRQEGVTHRVECDFIAGCDGSHGASRAAIPSAAITTYERVYPFGWLGILADVPPADHELIYASHARGFALASMRSSTRSRYYIQCSVDDDPALWSDERFWDELCLRLGSATAAHVTRGPSIEKAIAPLRSFVAEPMRFGKLFLAGDAAHIVPPTGAKGMNLAVSDAVMLAEALVRFYRDGDPTGIDGYSARALARIWKAERFSWWVTGLTHRFPEMTGFERKMQIAELAYLRESPAAQMVLAENYVGLKLV